VRWLPGQHHRRGHCGLGGVWANNQSASPNYGFNKSGPNYVFWWGISGDYNYLDVNGTWHWVQGGADRMSLTSAGSLAIPGNFNVSGDLTCSGNFSTSPRPAVSRRCFMLQAPACPIPASPRSAAGATMQVGFDWKRFTELTVRAGSYLGP
jgi:hypothetical protein